ncbi:MAG: hypothetical protein WD638_09570 [Nitriliruptoraceae bacterium]
MSGRSRWRLPAVGDQSGFSGGLESLAFGALVFVFGTLIILNAWAVVDARFATAAAAREAVRAVVEAEAGRSEAELAVRAEQAAMQALSAHGHLAEPTLEFGDLQQARCATIAVTVGLEIRATFVPGFADAVTYPVRSSHAEVIDPFRPGLTAGDGVVDCGF